MVNLPRVTKKDAGYYLRVWRAERNLSMYEAAPVFGIKSSMWSLLEDGLRFASPRLARKLAKATGGPLEVFLNMEGK